MKPTVKKELKELKVKNFIVLFIAGMINAFGVTIFLTPVDLYDSGISGSAFLLSQVTPSYLTLSIFLVLLNIPLFLIGFKKQGLKFTIYACFSVLCYSVWAFLIEDVLPIDVAISSPLAETDLVLCSIFGGLISGVGSGLAIRNGGAMDGIEVLAVIFAKRLMLTVGSFVMIFNVCLYVIAGIIFQSFVLPLYSIIAYAVALKTVDFIVEGLDRAKAVFIITEKPDEICSELSVVFNCGITMLDAKGYYSSTEKSMIYIVINRFQIRKAKELIQSIDNKAYITINEVADVYKASHSISDETIVENNIENNKRD